MLASAQSHLDNGQALIAMSARLGRWNTGGNETHLTLMRASKKNASWPEIFGTSPWRPTWKRAFLAFRIALTALFSGHLLTHLLLHWDGGYYAIALTNWMLVTQVFYFATATLTTWMAQKAVATANHTSAVHLPLYAKVQVALMHIAVPGSVLVGIGFWPLVAAVGLPAGRTVQYLTVFSHGANTLLCILDLAVSGIPFSPRYGLLLMMFLFAFGCWSFLHFVFRVGMKNGCRRYEENERCPIYAVLDWNRPLVAGVWL